MFDAALPASRRVGYRVLRAGDVLRLAAGARC
jgi:hypothetical protein